MPAYQRSPGAAPAAVTAGLDDFGLSHLYLRASSLASALSTTTSVAASCNVRILRWWQGRTQTQWPIADAAGATRTLVKRARQDGQ